LRCFVFFLTIKQNKFWKAEIPLFERAVKYQGSLGRLHLLLAKAYYFDGRFTQAIAEYTKALRILDGYAQKTHDATVKRFYLIFLKEIHFDLAHSYENIGDLFGAVDHYKKAITIDGKDVFLYNNLAGVYLKLNKADEAMLSLKKALEIKSDDQMSLQNLEQLLKYKEGIPSQ